MALNHSLASNAVAGHSARVVLLLHIPGLTVELADVGPKDAHLRQPKLLPLGSALLEIVTDGRSYRKEVTIAASSQHTNLIEFA